MCDRRPALPPYLQPGTRLNERYLACMNLVREDYPCICGRCELERKEPDATYMEELRIRTLNRRIQ